MKSNGMKIFAISAFMIFIGTGVALTDDRGNHRGHAYGHYKHKVHHHYHYAPLRYHYAPLRPVYIEHHYRPVAVERHYYPAPVYCAAPAPSGFFFGMSVADAGSAFSFGIGGR